MAFNNVPVNGWPQIKKLEELDVIAKKVDGMPVFSSTDRDWLDEWESKLPELPADPETDGVKVLTATTESGETTKSWEEPESSTWDYSTSEVDTGQKWIDGKDIFCKVYNNIQLTNSTDVTVDANFGSDKNIIKFEGVGHYSHNDVMHYAGLGNYMSTNDKAFPRVDGNVLKIIVDNDWSEWTCHFIIYYTKPEAQQTRKRGK